MVHAVGSLGIACWRAAFPNSTCFNHCTSNDLYPPLLVGAFVTVYYFDSLMYTNPMMLEILDLDPAPAITH